MRNRRQRAVAYTFRYWVHRNRLCAKVLTDSEAAISTRVQAVQVIASFTEEEANKMIKWRTDLALDEDPDFFKVFSR